MAFVTLPEAMQRLGLSEPELKALVKKEGIQVFMADRDGGKVICFKGEDLSALEKPSAPSQAPEPEEDLMVEDDSMDLELDDDSSADVLDLDGAPDDSLDLDLGGDLMDDDGADMTLDIMDSDSFDPEPEPQAALDSSLEETVLVDAGDSMATLDIDGSFEDDGAQTLSLDDNADFSTNDTLSIGDDNDTLSFDTDGAETLSLDSDDTLGFEGSDNLSLPDESFSIDEDEDELGVDDDDDEVESSRPTTEIIDEDEVNFVFPLLVLVSFGLIIFNGMIIFGMLQELGGDSSVATGENFYASIKDFVTSNFPSPK